MFNKICTVCSKGFESRYNHTLVCSDPCRNIRLNNITGRLAYQKDLPSGTVGAISEMVVAVDLMEKGYSVFRALSPACKSDLVAKKNDTVITVEVRTGYSSAKGGCYFPRRRDDEADVYGIYIPAKKEISYFNKDGKTVYEL